MIFAYYRRPLFVIVFALVVSLDALADGEAIPPESSDRAAARHERVARRRQGIQIICHRGAVEFAHENTLEAYRASFDLGADGNEIDIRATKDGVLICFHDDTLDQLLEAYGDASDYSWEQLRGFRFHEPGPFGKDCRIPTLVEALELHRQHAGLVQLDIKRPEIMKQVMDLVDRMDMWDHVVAGPAGADNRKINVISYKAGLYLDRSEVDQDAIAEALKKPGNGLILEDPRGVAVLLGRQIRLPPRQPVAPINLPQLETESTFSSQELLDTLRRADDWDHVADGEEAEAKSASLIVRRAESADQIGRLDTLSDEAFELLRQRVVQRSLHKNWRYHGLDGAAALRVFIRRQAPAAVELARFCLWRDDPACETVMNPQWNNPRSWTDWRTKGIVFPELSKLPGPETERLCREYLALSDEAARKIGVPQFEAAAKTLLSVTRQEEVAVELIKHRRGDVRGRAILICVANADGAWAERALSRSAPHALAYVLPKMRSDANSQK